MLIEQKKEAKPCCIFQIKMIKSMSWLKMKTMTSIQIFFFNFLRNKHTRVRGNWLNYWLSWLILFSYTGLVVRCHWECIHTQEEVHGHQARRNSHGPEQYISLFLPYTKINYKNYIKKKQQQNKSLFFDSKKRKKKEEEKSWILLLFPIYFPKI